MGPSSAWACYYAAVRAIIIRRNKSDRAALILGVIRNKHQRTPRAAYGLRVSVPMGGALPRRKKRLKRSPKKAVRSLKSLSLKGRSLRKRSRQKAEI